MAAHINAFNEQLRAAAADTKTQFQAAKMNMAYTSLANNERMTAGVSKVPYVVEFVENMMDNEESVVVYCHHLVVHDLLHQKLVKYHPVSIIGGQSDHERQEAIDVFQAKGTLLMIAGIRAGSLGINLTAGNYVIFAELDWSPAVHRQAEDRLHRIGQKSPVFAYYLEGKGTYDEHIAEILVDKKLEIDELLGDATKSDDYVPDTSLNAKAKELVAVMEKRFNTLNKTLSQESNRKP
jgi:SNF2 family DNA or RNA helicase